jgi:hypothetical protein
MTTLRFAERYALVDEETFNRYLKSGAKGFSGGKRDSTSAASDAVARSARALRDNLDNPFTDTTQKALAHTQLMRDYLADVARLNAHPSPRSQSLAHSATTTPPGKTARASSPHASPLGAPPDSSTVASTSLDSRADADDSTNRPPHVPQTIRARDRAPSRQAKKKTGKTATTTTMTKSLARKRSFSPPLSRVTRGRKAVSVRPSGEWERLKRERSREERPVLSDGEDDDDDDKFFFRR